MFINGVMLQAFEWYLGNDDNLYNRLKAEGRHLAKKGVTGAGDILKEFEAVTDYYYPPADGCRTYALAY